MLGSAKAFPWVLVAMVGFALSACGSSGGGAASDNHVAETVVYVASDGVAGNGETELYAVDDDGQNRRRLSAAAARSDADIAGFAISPDGQWVAYRSDLVSGFEIDELYVVPTDGGSPPQQVSRSVATGTNRSVKGFAWSPDSSRIAYTANLDGALPGAFFANEVFLVDRNGGNEVKINGGIGSPPSVEVRNPRWSPDGRYILQEVAVFNGSTGAANPFALNIYDTQAGMPNSTRVVNLAGNTTRTVRNIHWSPDSVRFSYTADVLSAQGVFQVWVTQVNTTTNPFSQNGSFNSDSRWSPDGSTLAYLDHPSQPNPSDLVVSPVTDGTADTVLVELSPANAGVTDFEWSPDGASIAYRANQLTANVFELFVVPSDGSGSGTRVSGPMVASGDAFAFAWSPDGGRIAYVADQNTDTVLELYTSRADGAGNARLTAGLSGEEVDDFKWSADSVRVAFATGPLALGATTADKLYVSRPDGVDRRPLSEATQGGPIAFSY